jgi:hypothetical protein
VTFLIARTCSGQYILVNILAYVVGVAVTIALGLGGRADIIEPRIAIYGQ